jgi:hypothetical protein
MKAKTQKTSSGDRGRACWRDVATSQGTQRIDDPTRSWEGQGRVLFRVGEDHVSGLTLILNLGSELGVTNLLVALDCNNSRKLTHSLI